LPQAPGQKEARYMHLFYGEIDASAQVSASALPAAEPAVALVQARNERIAQLEERVATLEHELTEMKAAFAVFREQFE
jgi:uncharacterized protein YceH (UPF0502 family)